MSFSWCNKGVHHAIWKPMRAIGPGVAEIRVHADGEYRVVYVAKFRSGIHVLHTFVKKTRKTAASDLRLAKQRYRELISEEAG